MKKIFAIALAVTASISGAAPLTEREAKDLVAGVKKVDADLKARAGITIREVSLLLQQSSTTYQPKWVLERSGDLKVLQEMESAGFIKLYIRNGLPDGSQNGKEFVNYEATDSGILVIAALQ